MRSTRGGTVPSCCELCSGEWASGGGAMARKLVLVEQTAEVQPIARAVTPMGRPGSGSLRSPPPSLPIGVTITEAPGE